MTHAAPDSREAAVPRQRRMLRRAASVAGNLLLLLVVAVTVALAVVPVATGGSTYTILTSSMEPSLPPGTVVVDRPIAPDRIRPGDVVTYQLESGRAGFVTHRVVAVLHTDHGVRIRVKGDANSAADPLILPAQVRGKVWYSVPLVGWIGRAGGPVRDGVVLVAAGVAFAYAAWMIGSFIRERRRRRAVVA